MKPNNKNVIITGAIFSSEGHTDFTGTLDEAVAVIMDQVKNAGKWVVANETPFIFNTFDAREQDELKDLLMKDENPKFVITGALQGGKAVFRNRAVRAPLSKVLGDHQCPQLAVVARTRNGKTYYDVVVSQFAGAQKNLLKNQEAILASIRSALRNKGD